MRVLIIIETLGLGGAEQSLVYQLPALAARGYECHVAALRPPYALSARLEGLGVQVHRLDVVNRRNMPLAAYRVSRVCRRAAIELAHAKLFHPSLALALSRALGPDIPRVVSFHNLAYEYPDTRMRRELVRFVEGNLLRRGIDAYAALSRGVASSFERALGLRQVRVVPNAVPCPEAPASPDARRAARASFDLPEGTVVLTMPARLVPQKGHAIFLEALARLKAERVPFYAVVAGVGPERVAIQQAILRLELDGDVRFIHEGLSHARALELMAASDVVAVPSLFEGFGLAPAEAMAQGTAVVASTAGGLVDLIEDERSGLLVPPGDAAALSGALRRVIEDVDTRQRLALAGHERVKTHFSPERVAELWDNLYRSLRR